MVRNEFPEAQLIEPGRNTGYAVGNNLAFDRAEGDWILALNPDTEVFPNTLDRAIETLQDRPAYGTLAARLIDMDGQIQRSIRAFPTAKNVLPWRQRAYRLDDFDYETEGPAPQPMGTFLLFRREALAAIGAEREPFDEHFPIFFNEVDLLYRLQRAGWPALYCPGVAVRHHGGFSTKQVRKEMIWESHRSLGRYLRKHGLVRNPGVYQLGLNLAALARAKGYREGFRP